MDRAFEDDIRQKLQLSQGHGNGQTTEGSAGPVRQNQSQSTQQPQLPPGRQQYSTHPQSHARTARPPRQQAQSHTPQSTAQQQQRHANHRPSQQQRRMQTQGPQVTTGQNLSQSRAVASAQQNTPLDPSEFQRGGQVAGYYQRPQGPPRQLYNPNNASPARSSPMPMHHDVRSAQSQHLESLANVEIARVAMVAAERDEKEAFRERLESIVQEVCKADPERLPIVSLQTFGSFRSGFANAGSDMDLVIVLPDGSPANASLGLLEDDLPRALEKKLLQLGFGARLLTRTRVPIIKICEKPAESLLDKLREEREKWDYLDHDKKYPHLHEYDGNQQAGPNDISSALAGADGPARTNGASPNGAAGILAPPQPVDGALSIDANGTTNGATALAEAVEQLSVDESKSGNANKSEALATKPRRDNRPFTRERKAGPLDFSKSGVGIQCDINFFNPLGLHNTQLLRCYAFCDPRVTPMILFIKQWAKKRKINSSYSGTLSSYGYVLMVLHYLVNVARPAVLPNLQGPWRPSASCQLPGATRTECDGWTVDFWRNEEEIARALKAGQMSTNNEPLGSLLNGFFDYFSSMGNGPKFHWMQQVLSLRSQGGIQTKEEKGWVKAITEEGEGKKVQHRYLFCIEDPFELAHNVARTVTHPGIVAIRDEFRRAKRILMDIGFGREANDGGLFDELVEEVPEAVSLEVLEESTNGAVQTLMQRHALHTAQHAAQQNQRQVQNRGGNSRGPPNGRQQVQATKTIDMADNDAFPTLGGGCAKAKSKPTSRQNEANTSEISGEKAQALLAKIKQEKAGRHAEATATDVAESVLRGLD
ncbi:hypothetical protein LTR78_000887 [Recurvomyces mirabilis]|uniref:polynucleotide adenylyltransferase n=1 Tax=Recurvomyces mirabilis TaxID=574656 RepID=A0AAE0WWX6_9PEZI|nr:hypothetical protein LTR78_000887 [Recurvomyces mirabilis]KAK5158858.1 hypothetical protein LTS14_002966 [Recurvomyces mirabilis]